MYADYDPKRHDGKQLYAIESGQKARSTVLRPVTDPAEIAAARLTPYFYVVDDDNADELPVGAL